MHRTPSRRLIAVNILGALGYLSLLIEWAWVALVFVYPLAEKGQFSWFMPSSPVSPIPPPAPIEMTPLTVVAVSIIVALCLVATIYALVKLPGSIGRTGARVTHMSAKAIIPRLTGHKKIPRSRLRRLSFRVIVAIKLLLIIIPLLITLFIPEISVLPRDVIWVIMVFLMCWPLFYFGLQTVLARLLKLDPALVW